MAILDVTILLYNWACYKNLFENLEKSDNFYVALS